MADMCAYCSLDTGGNHETNCPLCPGNNPKLNYSTHPLMGSGYDQGFKAGRKQGGAEELAACIKKIDPDWLIEILRAYNDFAELDSSGTYPRNVVDEGIESLETLHQLQPGAGALEALLREERVKFSKIVIRSENFDEPVGVNLLDTRRQHFRPRFAKLSFGVLVVVHGAPWVNLPCWGNASASIHLFVWHSTNASVR